MVKPVNVFGLVHAENAPESNAHSKDAMPEEGAASVPWNVNVADAVLISLAGPESITVSGGTVSIFRLKESEVIPAGTALLVAVQLTGVMPSAVSVREYKCVLVFRVPHPVAD